MDWRSHRIQSDKAIKYVWKKGGTEGSPSSIPFRKSAVSKVYTTNHSNELQGNLADLIVHNIKTACKFYACMHECAKRISFVELAKQTMT